MKEFDKFSKLESINTVTSTNVIIPDKKPSFILTELENKRFQNWRKEGCKGIKFEFCGIGTKVSVQAKNNKWVDITDYGYW